MAMRIPSVVAEARPVMTTDRGLNSNASSSTPKRVAATGIPNTGLDHSECPPGSAPAADGPLVQVRIARHHAAHIKLGPRTCVAGISHL